MRDRVIRPNDTAMENFGISKNGEHPKPLIISQFIYGEGLDGAVLSEGVRESGYLSPLSTEPIDDDCG